MLFSHTELAEYLSASFECAWESLRPVPQVDIDFGNGHRLHRTLNGNIATWFCTPEGQAFDLLPGLVSREEYRKRATVARAFHHRLGAADDFREWVVRFHDRALDSSTDEMWSVAESDLRSDLRKMIVEFPLKKALEDPTGFAAESMEGGSSVLVSELPRRADDRDRGEPDLVADTQHNSRMRYAPVHRLLRDRPLARPAELTSLVFATVLGVDLEDPYLGLAPYVLGGEGGRRTPQGDL